MRDLKLEIRPLKHGEGGIRTHETLAGLPHFECGAFVQLEPPLRTEEVGFEPTVHLRGRRFSGPLPSATRATPPMSQEQALNQRRIDRLGLREAV